MGVIKEMGMKEDHLRNVVHDVVKECLVCSERKSPGRQIGQKLPYSSNEILKKIFIVYYRRVYKMGCSCSS